MFAITWIDSPAFAETRSAYASTCTGRRAAAAPEGAESPRVSAQSGSPANAFSAVMGLVYPAGRPVGYTTAGTSGSTRGVPAPLEHAIKAHAAAIAALRMARDWVLAPSRATNSVMNAVGCRTRARPRRALTCSAQVEDRPLVGAGVRAKPCVRIHRGRAADHR